MMELLEILGELFGGVLGGLWDSVSSLWAHTPTPKYTAHFEDVKSFLSRRNTGFSVTGKLHMPLESSFSNAVCWASSGSGKTSGVIIPSCFSIAQGGNSMVILNPGQDIYPAVSGYLAKQGYTIVSIDWTSLLSAKFNPYDFILTVQAIGEFANLLTANSKVQSKGDDFWASSCEMTFTVFIRLQIFHRPKEERHLGRLLELIELFSADPTECHKLFIATNDAQLISTYKALNTTPEKTLQSVLITCRVALKLLLDPIIAANCKESSFDLDSLRTRKTAVFLSTPLNQLGYTSTLTAVFLQTLFNRLMSRTVKKTDKSVLFLLDEISTIKFNLSMVISQIRKFRAGILLCVQDYASLQAVYSSAECQNIKSNCLYQIYIGHQPLSVCQELSKLLGKYSELTDEGEETGSVRELMSIDQLRVLDGVLILAGGNAMRAPLVPYYSQRQFLKWSQLPPHPLGT